MLKSRFITGTAIGILLIFTVIFSRYTIVTSTVFLIIGLLSLCELFKATGIKNIKHLYYPIIILSVFIYIIPVYHYKQVLTVCLVLTALFFIICMAGVGKISAIHPAFTIFLSMVMILFFKAPVYMVKMNKGIFILAITILITTANDVFAYFFGKKFGRHKLAPLISPNKTVEGSIFGGLFSIILCVVFVLIFEKYCMITIENEMILLYAVLCSIVGQFGDLALSSLKRIYGIKDYGNILPGHGGILDRFDSMLFTLPFTYIFFGYLMP